MKIKFVKGFLGYRGAMVMSSDGHLICGQYRKRMFYVPGEPKDELIVVKQKSIWFTILILIHELAHCINRKLFKGKKKDKINGWIDRNLLRKIDKRR